MPEEDFGTYAILPSASLGELGIRSYHVPFPERIILMIPDFRRSSTEPKFRALAETLAEHKIASAIIDLNRLGQQAYRSCEEMLWDIERAENYLATTYGWNVSAYVGHSLGAALVIEHIRARSRRDRRFFLKGLVFLAPALNQKILLRYWFFLKREQGKSWRWFKTVWSSESEDEWEYLFREDRERPHYAKTLENQDLSYDASRLDQEILHIHGSNDLVVPPQSISVRFANEIMVPHGDHDLEKPTDLELWVPRAAMHLVADHSKK